MNREDLNFSLALVGAPGSGKGTVATWLENEYRFYRICPGDLLRQEVENQTELGKQAQDFLQKGHLVPNALSILLVHQKILEKPPGRPLLFDGYPRTIDQFEALVQANLFPSVVLQLTASKSILLKRILGRRIHLRSGRVYHTEFSPPKSPGLDDLTLEPLVTRKDDTLDVALERIRQAQERDEQLLETFINFARKQPEQFKFEMISTECSITELRARLEQHLKRFGFEIAISSDERGGDQEKKIACSH